MGGGISIDNPDQYKDKKFFTTNPSQVAHGKTLTFIHTNTLDHQKVNQCVWPLDHTKKAIWKIGRSGKSGNDIILSDESKMNGEHGEFKYNEESKTWKFKSYKQGVTLMVGEKEQVFAEGSEIDLPHYCAIKTGESWGVVGYFDTPKQTSVEALMLECIEGPDMVGQKWYVSTMKNFGAKNTLNCGRNIDDKKGKHIKPAGDSISSEHFKLLYTCDSGTLGKHWFIRDSSTNGTFINNFKLNNSGYLFPGAMIRVGREDKQQIYKIKVHFMRHDWKSLDSAPAAAADTPAEATPAAS